MNKEYIEVIVTGEKDRLDLVFALVNEALSSEGVEELDNQLKFYFKQEAFNATLFASIVNGTGLSYTQSQLQEQNWNQLWEENFQPVAVEDFVYIRADFHPPASDNYMHEIVITPKMSFGTGHHATTYIMLARMRNLSFTGKSVIDFGTGTGILAIMAVKLGATDVTAIDYDDWCIVNSRENFERNQTPGILLTQADTFPAFRKFDIILANINRNIIVDNFDRMAIALTKGGMLVVSGLLESDRDEIVKLASQYHLVVKGEIHKNNWICLAFSI